MQARNIMYDIDYQEILNVFVSVTYDKWNQSQTSGLVSDFLFSNGLYYINNGFYT